jgi:ribosomal-protein-alanine N-acetyltransferase
MRRPVEPIFRFRRMKAEDLDRIVEIEKDGFRHPWSAELLRRELGHAWSTILLAVEEDDAGERILGFIVFWLVHDEVHVLNIAVAMEARRRGIGRALMEESAAQGRRRAAQISTLEVRRSNVAAITLY